MASKACDDFLRFCKCCGGDTFSHPWGADRRRLAETLARVIVRGGRAAERLDRGRGKTSIVAAAAAWSIVAGHRKFPLILTLKGWDDCAPLNLDGLHDGCAFSVRSINSSLRGLCKRSGEAFVRPDLVLIDDPLSSDDRASPRRMAEIEKIINVRVMGVFSVAQKPAVVLVGDEIVSWMDW